MTAQNAFQNLSPRRLMAGGALALGLLGLGGASQAQDRDKPLPGYWQYSYRAFIYNSDETKCLSKADVARFFAGLCNKGSTCTYTTNQAHDGKVRLIGEWVDHKGRRTKVNAEGVYDPKSFHLDAHVVLSIGVSLPVDGTIDGHYLGPGCPPGSESPRKR